MNLEANLLNTFATKHTTDLARLLESMPASDAAEVIGDARPEVAAELLRRITPPVAARCLEALPIETAVGLLRGIRPDSAATILRSANRTHRVELLERLPSEQRARLKRLMRYPQHSAGALMDSEALAVPATLSADQALERLKLAPQHVLYYVYVVSDDHKLIGVVNMRELFEARPGQLLGLMGVRTFDSVYAKASWESVLANPGWSRVHALPVIEADGSFVGVLRYESLRMLEAQSRGAAVEDPAAETGAAVSELYGVGLRSLVEWAGRALFGVDGVDGRQS